MRVFDPGSELASATLGVVHALAKRRTSARAHRSLTCLVVTEALLSQLERFFLERRQLSNDLLDLLQR